MAGPAPAGTGWNRIAPLEGEPMADIFVSYASADGDNAQAVGKLLAARGYSVWWDRSIPPGEIFDEVIQRSLDAAKCVVVLWSAASVVSNWVKTEAAEAAGRNILVPALIEDVRLPIEFKRIQSANLVRWESDPNHPEFQNLLAAVERVVAAPRLGVPPPSVESPQRFEPPQTSKSRTLPSQRILVVDDDRDAATALATLLELDGHETHVAHNGAEAVKQAAALRPDLVLLDIGLPDISGYEAARMIRAEPWGKSMRLVALTGWGHAADRARSAEAGFDRHLVKPVELEALNSLFNGIPNQ
jgi:CheY-like chemotaxis protein